MNKKGANWLGLGIFLSLIVLVAVVVLFATGVISIPQQQQTVIQQQQAEKLAEATKEGEVAQIKVYVRDLENNDINTKVAVATYCQDDKGNFVLDSTSSSTTAEITGTTSIGRTVTCWAFNSTYQSEPVVTVIDEEAEHILIDARRMLGAGFGKIEFYEDDFDATTGAEGLYGNLTVGASQTGTLPKMKFTVNGTDTAYNLGGFYFNTTDTSNVETIDISGSASLSGMDHASTQIVKSDLVSKQSVRKRAWDFVFEIDDDSTIAGNQPLLMHESDYLETGSVTVTADGTGCSAGSDRISSFAFMKGYYRSASENAVKFGHETDAQSPAVIGSDVVGTVIFCT